MTETDGDKEIVPSWCSVIFHLSEISGEIPRWTTFPHFFRGHTTAA